MLECLILGDSIASGIHYYNQLHGKMVCESHSTVGISSYRWNLENRNRELKYKTIVISLGTNDHSMINTRKELLNLRSRIVATQVWWVMPTLNPQAQGVVKEISIQYGDRVVTARELTKDKIHPSINSYKNMVKIINETRARQ